MPWTSTLSLSLEVSGYDASTELILNPFPPRGESRLQVRYAVLGLYRAGLAIAQGNKFYELDAALYVGDEEVGWLEFRPKDRAVLENVVDVDYSPALNASIANDTTTAMVMVMADSGTVWDPDDRSFALTFRWDGVRIKAQDIFTTFLDGLATAAEHNNTDPDAYIPAARSASGDTVLSTWTLGEGGNAEMTWARLKRALIMMWDLLIVGQRGRKTRFEGLSFGLEYEGKAIGAGRMLRFD